jgi:mannose-1-phosphate guanylyltransferase
MKAVVLSGGEGTRVRPLTYEVPKPMVPIIERPIISYLFDLLKAHRFNEVIVTVSYKANMLEDHYQNGHEHGMHIAYSLEGSVENGELVPEALGSAGGLKKVQKFANFFDDSFLVVCGDAIIDLDLSEAMRFHKSHGGLATIVCKQIPKEEVFRYGVVVTDERGKIESFQEKPNIHEAKSNIINTGIYIFEPEVLNLVPDNQKYDIGGELLPLMVEKKLPFYAYAPDFQWLDVGTTRDFYYANMKLLQGEIDDVTPYGKEIRPNVWVGINCDIDFDTIEIVPPVYIGNGVRIRKGAKIMGPTMIGAGCLIDEGVSISHAVVLHHTKINKNLHFHKRIITSQYIIDPEGGYVDLKEVKLDFLIHDARQGRRQLSPLKREIKEVIESLHES